MTLKKPTEDRSAPSQLDDVINHHFGTYSKAQNVTNADTNYASNESFLNDQAFYVPKSEPNVYPEKIEKLKLKVPKRYTSNRKQCLKKGRRCSLPIIEALNGLAANPTEANDGAARPDVPSRQFTKPFVLFEKITWTKPDWLIPLHNPVCVNSRSRNTKNIDDSTLCLDLNSGQRLCLDDEKQLYTLQPMFGGSGVASLRKTRTSNGRAERRKAARLFLARVPDDPTNFSIYSKHYYHGGAEASPASQEEAIKVQLVKRARAISLRRASIAERFRGPVERPNYGDLYPLPASDEQSPSGSPNGAGLVDKKKSRRGGRRVPLALPSPYLRSSGSPSSPHSLEACISSLDESERLFCVKTKLDPRVYQNAKDTMIKHSLTVGLFKKTAAQKMFRMDVNKTGKIYDFIASKNWMQTP